MEFYQRGFGATVLYQIPPGGVAQLAVGSADFWVAEESPAHQNFSPQSLNGCSVRMLLVTDEPDTLFARALAAGAKEVRPLTNDHGWRLGRLVDVAGHHWEIGKQLGV